MERYSRSLELLKQARLWTPNGTQTSSKAAVVYPEGAYPVFIERGLGAHVFDVDENKYLDFVCSLASITLGHDRPEIRDAVISRLYQGSLFSLPHRLEFELAERFCTQVAPWAESIRWVKTGSESCESAVRIARMETGRDIVLSCGYHGWHSAFMAAKQQHPGVPKEFEQCIIDFPYNDLPTLDRLLDRFEMDVAAIIVEPMLHDVPNDGWLKGIRERCDRIGALMICDELICALRWAIGGGSQYFDVCPDLATYGKAIGGGIPIACIAGKRELMRHARLTSSTFGGDLLGLAACEAVLNIYQSEPIIETLWARGRQFQDGFNEIAKDVDIPVLCDGFAVKPRIVFSGTAQPLLPMSLFLQETALRGILWHPAGGNISAAMRQSDIDWALEQMRAALKVVELAYLSGNWSALKGQPIQQAMGVRQS